MKSENYVVQMLVIVILLNMNGKKEEFPHGKFMK